MIKINWKTLKKKTQQSCFYQICFIEKGLDIQWRYRVAWQQTDAKIIFLWWTIDVNGTETQEPVMMVNGVHLYSTFLP